MDNLKKREINFWWSLILPLLAVALSVGMAKSTLNAHAKAIERVEYDLSSHEDWGQKKHEDLDNSYLMIQIQLAEISKDILYIKERLPR